MSRTAYDLTWASMPQPAPHLQQGQSFWSKEDPQLKGNKVLRGGMFSHQREFWNLDSFIKLLVGGYGSGKSLQLCKRGIAACLQNAPVPGAIVSPTYPMAKLTTVPTMKALLSGKRSLLGRDFWWRFVNSPPPFFEISYRGRLATILIMSGEHPDRLKGGNLGWVGIDEPFIQDQEVFEQMVARARHPQAQHIEICLTGTPEELNWGYELCEGDLNDRYDVGVVHASSYQNLSLPDGYVERMEKGFDEEATTAFVYGNFVNLAKGRVYYGFTDDNIVSREMPDGAKIGVGMDFNVNPMAFVLFWYKGASVHVIKEYELPNSDTELACYKLREHPLIGDRRIDVYPDASGKARKTSAPGGRSDYTILKDEGFIINAHSANPAVRDRYNAVNAKLKPKEGQISLTVDPSCKHLIKYMRQYTHEKINKDEGKKMSHLLDALGYPIAYRWPAFRKMATAVRHTGA